MRTKIQRIKVNQTPKVRNLKSLAVSPDKKELGGSGEGDIPWSVDSDGKRTNNVSSFSTGGNQSAGNVGKDHKKEMPSEGDGAQGVTNRTNLSAKLNKRRMAQLTPDQLASICRDCSKIVLSIQRLALECERKMMFKFDAEATLSSCQKQLSLCDELQSNLNVMDDSIKEAGRDDNLIEQLRRAEIEVKVVRDKIYSVAKEVKNNLEVSKDEWQWINEKMIQVINNLLDSAMVLYDNLVKNICIPLSSPESYGFSEEELYLQNSYQRNYGDWNQHDYPSEADDTHLSAAYKKANLEDHTLAQMIADFLNSGEPHQGLVLADALRETGHDEIADHMDEWLRTPHGDHARNFVANNFLVPVPGLIQPGDPILMMPDSDYGFAVQNNADPEDQEEWADYDNMHWQIVPPERSVEAVAKNNMNKQAYNLQIDHNLRGSVNYIVESEPHLSWKEIDSITYVDVPKTAVNLDKFPRSLREDGIVIFHANDSRLQAQGLQNIQDNDFPDNAVMVFYKTGGSNPFHMRNVNFPIDILFTDEDFIILDKKRMEPGNDLYYPPRQAVHAVETKPGWLERRGLKVGDILYMLQNKRVAQFEEGEETEEEEFVDLFHYANKMRDERPSTLVIEPEQFEQGHGFTRRDRDVSSVNRAFFYTDPEHQEQFFKGAPLYKTSIPKGKMYDLTEDPEGYLEKHRHPTYGLRKGEEWNNLLNDLKETYTGVVYGPPHLRIAAVFEPLEGELQNPA